MLDSNIIKVSLRSSKTIKTIPLHRWDTGMKLEFEGIDIPLNTTCQFETGNGEAMLQLVDTETKRVDIPNDLLGQYCYQDIRAHLYVTNSSYGMTVYDIFIPVIQREQPADHISPDNTQTIEEWITEQVGVVDDDRQSIENMSATASVDNNTGTPAVTVTKTTVSDHVNLDFAFVNIKGAKGDDGADGADGVTPSFSIGTVTQVSSMSPPWVTVTGTDEEPVLNFGLPKGEDGDGVKLRNVNIYEDSGATRGKITTVSAVVGYTTYDIDLYNIRGAQGVAGDNFNEAHLYTDSGLPRVELTPYAVYLDGHKTYDIDFYNIDGLPTIEGGDAGKVVAVNEDEDGYELVNQSGGLPSVSSLDDGKALMVDSNGDWVADNIPTELPFVNGSDNGKVLGVASGVWTKVAAPSGLPAATSADEGKLLGVDSNGDWGKTNPFAEETWTFTLSDNTVVTKTLLCKVVS